MSQRDEHKILELPHSQKKTQKTSRWRKELSAVNTFLHSTPTFHLISTRAK